MALRIAPLSTLNPPSSARTWQSVAHPSLPLVATASSDKTVRIYSLTSFTLLSTVSGGHKRSVRCVAWKPGARKGEAVLATGSFDASAGIWKKYYGGSGGVGEDGPNEVEIRGGVDDNDDYDDDNDGEDYAFTVLLDGHESEIKSLAFSGSSRFLATCSRDKSVWIWEELEDDNWETVAVLQEHDGDVKCVAWHPTEEILASGSYDDTVRIYKEDVDDWVQVAVINGHDATVWWVEFEDADQPGLSFNDPGLSQEQRDFLIGRKGSGARLVTCSDDLTIRVWRRLHKEPEGSGPRNTGMPSIIRSHSIEEDWVQEAILPAIHDRSIYAVSISHKTGLIASSGSDGKIVIYKEVWKGNDAVAPVQTNGTGDAVEASKPADAATAPPAEEANLTVQQDEGFPKVLTEWIVVAELENAHGVFEVNHICWAKRWDKDRKGEDEEILMTTGDDGEVKIWKLEDE